MSYHHDVLVTPKENGGYSIVIDGMDVSYFTSHFSVSVAGGEEPVVTLHVIKSRLRMGLPKALVEAIPDAGKDC